jgi:Spo12 family protein
MSSNVLSPKDANATMTGSTDATVKPDVKTMEYHRQVLQSKIEEAKCDTSTSKSGNNVHPNINAVASGKQQQYISPSDNIMSPCTAKLSAYRNKQVTK